MTSRRAALVTGGSSGIGFAIAQVLGELGYDLSLVARDTERLAEAQSVLSAGGARVRTIAADLAEPDAAGRVLDAHPHHRARLDVLVHSAGVGLCGGLEQQSSRRVDLQIEEPTAWREARRV
jgi:short-subunit dehydrogenase